MDDARAQREAIADGVRTGYAEAMVSARVWSGKVHRAWRPVEPITPEQAERTFDRIALMFPRAVH